MTYKTLLARAEERQKEDNKKYHKKTSLNKYLLNEIFENRYTLDEKTKNALLAEMSCLLIDSKNNLINQMQEYESDLLED